MTGLSVFGFLVGIDNVAVIAGLGLASLAWDRKLWLLGAFALFEGGMPVAGHLIGTGVVAGAATVGETVGLISLAACGLLILLTAVRDRALAGLVDRRSTMVLLALLLSVDNLAAGIGFGALQIPLWASALLLGGVSALMCVAGLALGQTLRRFVPRHANLASGAYLMVLAAALAVFE